MNSSCLASIQNDLTKLRKQRRIDLFQEYLKSQRFRSLFAQLPPDKIEACIIGVERARKSCRLPAPPKPIGQERLTWSPALKAKLGRAYARFGPKAHVAVAAEMGLSVGQARLAKRRFLDLPSAAWPLAA